MPQLFEYIDTLHSPYEAFAVNSRNYNDPPRPHWHYYIELIHVDEGTVRIECDDRIEELRCGDLAIFHPRRIHMVSPADSLPYRYGVLKFDVNRLNSVQSYSPKLRVLVEQAGRTPSASIIFRAGTTDDALITRAFRTCIDELAGREYGYDVVVHAAICETMVSLARIWRSEGVDAGICATPVPGDGGIASITEYIDEHSAEPLSAVDLASRCGMSYSHFAKNFRAMYGRSCKEYIEFVRVCKAEDLLLFTDLDLTHISIETGFSDCSHLIKIFRRWKGTTPKQYRMLHTGAKRGKTGS